VTRDETSTLLRRIASVYATVRFTDGAVDEWADTLGVLTYDEANHAFGEHKRVAGRAPTPADLLRGKTADRTDEPRPPRREWGCSQCDRGWIDEWQPHVDAHLGKPPIAIIRPCPSCR
jgi:hypothetical protein